MRLLLIAAAFLAVAAAILQPISPKSVHLEEPKSKKGQETDLDREIMQALNTITGTRKTIATSTDEKPTTILLHDEGFFDNIENIVNDMLTTVHNAYIPFVSSNEKTTVVRKEAGKPEIRADRKGPVESYNKSTPNNTESSDLLAKTRDELKRDISTLQSFVVQMQDEIDEWVISNRHQNVKSLILGALSAAFVIIVYLFTRKVCRRRSRLGALAAFANDGYANQTGDNESLLPTNKKNRRFPSNSDEDI